MNHSEKLNFILENGIANKVADFIPRICEDSDILMELAENVHKKSLYYKEIESMDEKIVEIFNNCIEIDYKNYIEFKEE